MRVPYVLDRFSDNTVVGAEPSLNPGTQPRSPVRVEETLRLEPFITPASQGSFTERWR